MPHAKPSLNAIRSGVKFNFSHPPPRYNPNDIKQLPLKDAVKGGIALIKKFVKGRYTGPWDASTSVINQPELFYHPQKIIRKKPNFAATSSGAILLLVD